MQDLSLLAIPAFALAMAAYLVWDSRRSARLNERVPAKARVSTRHDGGND